MSGWIKIHRKITEWEWYDDANTFRLFMHLILKANHKNKKYRGQLVKTGSLLTGRELLSQETGLSIQQIRTCLNRLKSTNQITIDSTRQGTIIQVINYDKYQVSTNESTNDQPTINQQVTTNKNDKKERSVFIPPTADQVKEYCLDRGNNVDPNRFVDFYTAKGWIVGKSKMKDWKAAVRTWEKDSIEYIKQPKSSDQELYENVMKKLHGNDTAKRT